MSNFNLSEHLKTIPISSFRELAQRSGLSRYQIDKIRRGQWKSISLVGALRLATVLQLTWEEFLDWSQLQGLPSAVKSPQPSLNDRPSSASESLEYQHLENQHLENQLQQQTITMKTQFQREALHQLESWLHNWPKVVYAIHHDKPDLLAAKILPLLRPLELLLQAWGVEPIGTIGDRLPYSPQEHLPLSPVSTPGAPIEIQRPGYRHQGNLLFRAEVIPLPFSEQVS